MPASITGVVTFLVALTALSYFGPRFLKKDKWEKIKAKGRNRYIVESTISVILTLAAIILATRAFGTSLSIEVLCLYGAVAIFTPILCASWWAYWEKKFSSTENKPSA